MIALLLLLLAQAAEAREMERVCRVIDGDTFVMCTGERIRAENIDAAEIHCRCAVECDLAARATAAVVGLVAAGVALERRRRDRYGRSIARVQTPSGSDLGEELIARGLARRWTGRREPWC